MSEDPWERLQRESNQQSNQQQAGSGGAAPEGNPQSPLASTQTQQPSAAQKTPDQQSVPPPQSMPVLQSYISAPGTPGQATGAPYMPASAQATQGMWPQPQPTQNFLPMGGYSQGTTLTQAEAEALASSVMLRLIDESPPQVRLVFTVLEQRLGVNRASIGMGVAGFFAVYMIFGYFAQLLCNLVGFAIPAYASMRAIESTTKEDDTKWLTYWVVFACFSVVDFFADNILRYFPFYWLVKIIFLVYCFAPIQPNGSTHIYNKFIRPVFLRNEATVNKLAADAGAGIRTALQKAASSASKNE